MDLYSDRFIRYCDKASPDYESNYSDLNEIVIELFQSDEVGVSHDLLVEAMELLSKYHGFSIYIEKEAVMCNRMIMRPLVHMQMVLHAESIKQNPNMPMAWQICDPHSILCYL